MRTSELDYKYPEHLIATKPLKDFRTLYSDADGKLTELKKSDLVQLFRPNDLLIINQTQVEPRRVFSEDQLEVLFVEQIDPLHWKVLFPASRLKSPYILKLPLGLELKLVEKGLPQTVALNKPIEASYFQEVGEMALPPYIQKARGERHSGFEDKNWYQTEWAKNPGSSAAPTASLHFTLEDFEQFKKQGVQIEALTLHVGLGTFLPVKTENLRDHPIHSEQVEIQRSTIQALEDAKKNGGRVWALGTTVTRALEAFAQGQLEIQKNGDATGEAKILILPGYDFKVVDVLMTNFHQPQSTLLALVSAFAGLERVQSAYKFAIQNQFRLFSYGDLSIWVKTPPTSN